MKSVIAHNTSALGIHCSIVSVQCTSTNTYKFLNSCTGERSVKNVEKAHEPHVQGRKYYRAPGRLVHPKILEAIVKFFNFNHWCLHKFIAVPPFYTVPTKIRYVLPPMRPHPNLCRDLCKILTIGAPSPDLRVYYIYNN